MTRYKENAKRTRKWRRQIRLNQDHTKCQTCTYCGESGVSITVATTNAMPNALETDGAANRLGGPRYAKITKKCTTHSKKVQLNQATQNLLNGRKTIQPGKPRFEPWTLHVVIRGQPVDGVGTPSGINNSESGRIDRPVIFIDNTIKQTKPKFCEKAGGTEDETWSF